MAMDYSNLFATRTMGNIYRQAGARGAWGTTRRVGRYFSGLGGAAGGTSRFWRAGARMGGAAAIVGGGLYASRGAYRAWRRHPYAGTAVGAGAIYGAYRGMQTSWYKGMMAKAARLF